MSLFYRTTVDEFAERPLSTTDQILLCSFGQGLAGNLHRRQLRSALRLAGYPGSQSGHLIHASPLLVRAFGRYYRLRRCDE